MIGPSVTAAYATSTLVCLARNGGWVRGSEQISSCTGVPRPYLVKILSALAREELVVTKRGYRGGYGLARKPEEITLFDIVTAVDGSEIFERCFLGLGACSPDRECPVHSVWSELRTRTKACCKELTLEDLVAFDRWDLERDYRFGWDGGSGRQGPNRSTGG